MANLTPPDKEKVRYHLGYMGTGNSAASMQLGIPRPVQTVFLLESAMELVNSQASVDRIRGLLAQLEKLEDQMKNATCSMIAEQVGELKLRANYPDLLEREYSRWAKRLADLLGVPLYWYSSRFQKSGPGSSVPVVG